MKSMLKNTKGFTLVELLAVIVILALLIVITANTVLPMMNKSKEKAMVIYAESVLKRAGEAYIIDSMSSTEQAYSIEQLMGQNDYFGIVYVDNNKYSIFMIDEREKVGLKISNLTSSSIEESTDYIVSVDNYNSQEPEDFDTHSKCNDFLNSDSGSDREKLFNTNLIKVSATSGYINYKNEELVKGALVPSSDWMSSEYIEVEGDQQFYFLYKMLYTPTNAGYAWYDEGKNFISGTGLKSDASGNRINDLITAPSNAKYLRVSWKSNNNNGADVMLYLKS